MRASSALDDFCYETPTVILPGFRAAQGIPDAVLTTTEGIADQLGYRTAGAHQLRTRAVICLRPSNTDPRQSRFVR